MAARRTLVVLLVFTLGIALLPGAGAAEPDGVYISLGDSVAAGTRPTAAVTDTAYTDVLFDRAGYEMGLATHVDVSCPGEDSGELIDGDGSYCYSTAFTQLDYALATIAADPGAVRLITINIGANDVLACTDEPDMEVCAGLALNELAINLQYILTELRTATFGYDVPIVGMTYYNPLMAYQLSSDPAEQFLGAASPTLVEGLNYGVLEPVYTAFEVPVANVAGKFKTSNTSGARYPRNLRYICKFTYMCERDDSGLALSDWNPSEEGDQPDIHPTPRGHRMIASAFLRVMEKAGIL